MFTLLILAIQHFCPLYSHAAKVSIVFIQMAAKLFLFTFCIKEKHLPYSFEFWLNILLFILWIQSLSDIISLNRNRGIEVKILTGYSKHPVIPVSSINGMNVKSFGVWLDFPKQVSHFQVDLSHGDCGTKRKVGCFSVSSPPSHGNDKQDNYCSWNDKENFLSISQ